MTLVGAQGGIRTRDALECFSSVARVTAVHTFGRLPQAADRAILPLRIPRSWNGREPGDILGKVRREKLATLNFPNDGSWGLLQDKR